MKVFYVISLATVILLSLSPFVLLPRPTEFKRQGVGGAGQIVSYSTYGAKIRSLDPATCGDTMSAAVQGNIYEGLYGYHYLLRPIKVIPLLAEDMPEVSADGLTYTIRLRKGLKYSRNECFGRNSDGTLKTRTVRAEDFVLGFKRIADYHINTPQALAFIEDKLAGLQEYRDKTRAYSKGDFSRYDLPFEGVKALDEHTLRIKLLVQFPQLLYVLAVGSYAPVPREVTDYHLSTRDGRSIPMKERDPVIHDYLAVVGTGPYVMEKFASGGDVILRGNLDYREDYYPVRPDGMCDCGGSIKFGGRLDPNGIYAGRCEKCRQEYRTAWLGDPAKLTAEERKSTEEDVAAGLYKDAGKRIPFTDMLVMTFVPEDNPMWEMFYSRQVDVSGIPRQVYHQVITPGKELTDQWAKKGIRLLKYGSPAVYWLVFNMEDRALGTSKSLRQALCLAFNVEAYIDVLHNGRGIRAVNPVPSSFEGYQEAGPGPYAHFDLDAAKAKLVQARKELESAGVIRPGDPLPDLTVDLPGRDEEDRRMGEFMQKQFKKINIRIKIELNDWPTLQAKVENKQCQIYAMGWHADYPDPENFLQLYYGPNIKRGTNNSNYSNPKFDKLYEQVAKMPPSPERTKIYVQMIHILNEDCPVLLLSEPISFVLIHSWLHNLKPHPIGYGFARYHRIDVAERRAAGGKE